MNPTKTTSLNSGLTVILAIVFMLLPWQSAPAREVSDKEITSAVNASLLIDNAVSANSIHVLTNDGIVDLSGKVNNVLAKDRAEVITAATVGVRAIINRINVAPATMPPDDELEMTVRNALRSDPAVYAWEIDASAENGFVTLTGEVDSYAKKELAETVAKGVTGIIGIENNIEVEYQLNRLDHEIENEIVARLENEVRVNNILVDVEVDEGAVELSGTVGSLSEKNLLNSLSWVSGVNSVDSDDLTIRWWARDEMRRTEEFINRSDEEVEKSVEDALAYDPRVTSFNLNVVAVNGVVNLSGQVDNLAAKVAAEQTARNTIGVTTVKNYIKVQTEVPTDDLLKQRIAAALEEDPLVKRNDVNVSADNGWVYLRGSVNTSAQKLRAALVAQRQLGVLGVVNNIDFDYNWQPKPDWEIRVDVKSQMEWNAFIDESKITVSVENGIVTLNGKVESYSEKNEAEKNALQGGAKAVENDLEVENLFFGPYGPNYFNVPYYL